MTLSQKLIKVATMYAGAVQNCYHYWRPVKTAPWLIWAEDGGEEFVAGNHVAEQALTGSADYFTKDEFDPVIDTIQEAQNSLEGFAWSLNSVQYEEETELIHFEWSWVYTG